MRLGSMLIAVVAGLAMSVAQADAVLDRADLEAWLDGYLPAALQANDMAGAVVSVVKDGEVLLEKGYGYDDVAARRPVDARRTLFPIASITKTMTGTAVMQLVEQGRLDLDRDINEYLDFNIPPAWDGKPVTLRNLLTHTAGFDDLQKGSSPIDPQWYLTLEDYTKRRSPNRVYPPGDTPAYSNYGVSLAGYIVQRVTGESIEDYFKRHIFEPLGMQRSTLYQPVPAELLPDRVQLYAVASGPPQPHRYTNTRSAGGVSSTASDMARYMIAHLQDGQYGETQILRQETARLMHQRAFSPVTRINGMALSFFQEDYNGERIIGHDGDNRGVHTNMKLLLDRGVGFFVAFNSDGRNMAVYALRDDIFRDFVDRYFPAQPVAASVLPSAPEHARQVAGSYQSSRRLNGVLSVFMMFNGIDVTANADGTLAIPMPPTGVMRRFEEISPFVWREIGGKDLIEARLIDGRVVSLHNHPVGVLLKMPAWRSLGFNMPILIASFLAMLVAVLLWPVSTLARRHYALGPLLVGAEARVYGWARLGMIAMLVFLIGWTVMAMVLTRYFHLFNAGFDPWIRLLHLFGVVGVAGAGAASWSAWLTWHGGRSWWVKIGHAVLAALMLWTVWFIFSFNLITLSLDY